MRRRTRRWTATAVALLALLPVDLMVARHPMVRATLAAGAEDTRAALRTGGMAARLAGEDARALVRVAAVSWMGRLACDAAGTAHGMLAHFERHPDATASCGSPRARTMRVIRLGTRHVTVREFRVITTPAGTPCAETPPPPPIEASDTRDGS